MNFVPICFVDTSLFTATLLTRHRALFNADTRRQDTPGSPHHDTRSIILRGPKNASQDNWQDDVPHVDNEVLVEWKSARSLLSRIKNAAAPFCDGKPAVLGKVIVAALKPQGFIDWHVDEGEYADAHNRMHVCLIPSPGAWLYSGGEVAQMPVGQLTAFNNRVLHSAINSGPVERVHLIVDVRKP